MWGHRNHIRRDTEIREDPVTPMEATILCLGIYEETGSSFSLDH
jgi:hypothetical protein